MKSKKSNSSAGARRQANVRSGAYDGRFAPKRVECSKTESKREACSGSEWAEEDDMSVRISIKQFRMDEGLEDAVDFQGFLRECISDGYAPTLCEDGRPSILLACGMI